MKKNYKLLICLALLVFAVGLILNERRSNTTKPITSEETHVPKITLDRKTRQDDLRTPSLISKTISAGPVSGVKLIPTGAKARPENHGRTMLASGNVITLSPGKTLVLKCDKNVSVLKIEPDQKGERFLADHGSKGFAIYNAAGELTKKLPDVSTVLPERKTEGQFQWMWAKGDKLVAILEIYDKEEQNRYPETQSSPNEVRLFMYSLDADLVQELHVPSRSKGLLLRVDGVSTDGLLLLSEVQPDLYFDPRQGEFLDAYQIPD